MRHIFFKVIRQISRSPGTKNACFGWNWAFSDCNSTCNSPMATKWCTKLKVAQKKCHIVFQCQSSNLKVTRDKKSPILTRIERFRTVTPVSILWWLRNNAQRLEWLWIGAPFFFKVINKISRLHGTQRSQTESFQTVNNVYYSLNLPMAISEWVIKFNSLSEDSGQCGPYGPYKPCNHNLYIGIITFPHIDNTQSTGHN